MRVIMMKDIRYVNLFDLLYFRCIISSFDVGFCVFSYSLCFPK